MADTTMTEVIPVLPSRDVNESIAFFERIGFTKVFTWDEPGVPTAYGGISRDTILIHFFRCENAEVCASASCRVRMKGIANYYEQCKELGVIAPDGKLEEKPWGSTDFTVIDPSGVCGVGHPR